jgi:hypothetical protein
MRNYWLRIALGALAIFTVGMIAHSLIHKGMNSVKGVVEGSGPLSIPLAFVPFRLGGDKLGTLERLTLRRETPTHVTSVELGIKLRDSMVARGLEGCRLAANLEDDGDKHRGINIKRGSFGDGTFWCAGKDSTDDADLVEYGHAVLKPGNVTIPLYLESDLVDELQHLDFGEDSTDAIVEAAAEAAVDSTVHAVVDSTVAAEMAKAEKGPALRERMVDSLRAEGTRRADSARQVRPRHVADSARAR